MIRLALPRFYMPRGTRLEGRRVYLRPPRHRDWRAWSELRAASRSFLVPWEPTWQRDALGHAAYRRRLRMMAFEWRDDAGYSFLILRRNDDVLIGGVTLSHLRRGVSQTASLGYWVGAAFARQGHMTEALGLMLPFAFDRLGLHRVEAACLPHNVASRGLLTKLGFREEGYAREYLKIDGAWQDHVLYGLLRPDLRALAGTTAAAPARSPMVARRTESVGS
jgi:[ribosomal protein S5]-alanine N-acetyltransferase